MGFPLSQCFGDVVFLKKEKIKKCSVFPLLPHQGFPHIMEEG